MTFKAQESEPSHVSNPILSPIELGPSLKQDNLKIGDRIKQKITEQLAPLAIPQPESLSVRFKELLKKESVEEKERKAKIRQYKKINKKIESIQEQLKNTTDSNAAKIESLTGKMLAAVEKFERLTQQNKEESTLLEEKRAAFSASIVYLSQVSLRTTKQVERIVKLIQKNQSKKSSEINKLKDVSKKVDKLNNKLIQLNYKKQDPLVKSQSYAKLEKELQEIETIQDVINNPQPEIQKTRETMELIRKKLKNYFPQQFSDRINTILDEQQALVFSKNHFDSSTPERTPSVEEAAELIKAKEIIEKLQKELESFDDFSPVYEKFQQSSMPALEKPIVEDFSVAEAYKQLESVHQKLNEERVNIKEEWQKAKTPSELQKVRIRSEEWIKKFEEFNSNWKDNIKPAFQNIYDIFNGNHNLQYEDGLDSNEFLMKINQEIHDLANKDVNAYAKLLNGLAFVCLNDENRKAWSKAEKSFNTVMSDQEKTFASYHPPNNLIKNIIESYKNKKAEYLGRLHEKLIKAAGSADIEAAWKEYFQDLITLANDLNKGKPITEAQKVALKPEPTVARALTSISSIEENLRKAEARKLEPFLSLFKPQFEKQKKFIESLKEEVINNPPIDIDLAARILEAEKSLTELNSELAQVLVDNEVMNHRFWNLLKIPRIFQQKPDDQIPIAYKIAYNQLRNDYWRLSRERDAISKDWAKAKTASDFEKIRKQRDKWIKDCEAFNDIGQHILPDPNAPKSLQHMAKSLQFMIGSYLNTTRCTKNGQHTNINENILNFLKSIIEEFNVLAKTNVEGYACLLKGMSYICVNGNNMLDWIAIENDFMEKLQQSKNSGGYLEKRDEYLKTLHDELIEASTPEKIEKAWNDYYSKIKALTQGLNDGTPINQLTPNE